MRSILFVIPLAVAICVSTSYGQETKTGDDTQELAAAAKKLHGKWAGDAEKTAEVIKGMEDLELEESMLEMVLEQVGAIQVNFMDGNFEVLIGDIEMSGDWEVTAMVEKEESSFRIHTEPADDSEGEAKNFEIHIMDDTYMKMTDLDQGGPPIVLKRQTEEDGDE